MDITEKYRTPSEYLEYLDSDSNVKKRDALYSMISYMEEESRSFQEITNHTSMRDGLIIGIIIGISVGASLF